MAQRATTGTGELLERAAELDGARRAPRGGAARRAAGGCVLVAGEAGVGKTALVRAFCAQPRPRRGRCGARATRCFTPRPLGPLVDIADEIGGELAARRRARRRAAATSSRRSRTSCAQRPDGRRARGPALGRRGDARRPAPARPAGSRRCRRSWSRRYRDDELDRAHPLRIVLGELPGRVGRRGSRLAPLSPRRGRRARRAAGVDAGELHRRTGGNPFFVTEVLRRAAAAMPGDRARRGAGARRAARRPRPARCSTRSRSCPPRAELWLLEALADGGLDGLDACLASGMLRAERDARRASGTRSRASRSRTRSPPDRRVALHRAALGALAAAIGRRPDPARLAHHAEAAGDADAVLRYAPAAGERAAALGAHREAAAQFARALRFADALPPAARADLLERRSYECYLTDRIDRGARGAARGARRATARPATASARATRTAGCRGCAWFAGDSAGGRGRGARWRSSCSSRSRRAASSRWPTATWRSCACWRATTPARSTGASGRSQLAERLGETEIRRARAQQRRRRRADARRRGRSREARAEPRAGARGRARGARRPRVHEPGRAASVAHARLRARPTAHLAAGIAYCTRPRPGRRGVVYLIGLARAVAARAGPVGRRGRDAPTAVLAAPGRLAAEPDHAAGGARAGCAPAAAIPTHGRRSTRRWSSRGDGRAAAPRARRRRPRRGALARRRARTAVDARDRDGARARARLRTTLGRPASSPSGAAAPASPTRRRRRRGRARTALELAGDAADGRRSAGSALGCPYEAALALADGDDDDALRRAPRRAAAARARGRPRAASHARLRERGVRDIRARPARRRRARTPPGSPRASWRCSRCVGRRAAQRRDRRPAVRVGAHRRPPRLGDPAEARRRHARPGGGRGRPARHRRKIGSSCRCRRRGSAVP